MLTLFFCGKIAIGGARYVLVCVDHIKRYNWVFSLTTLSKTTNKEAFDLFCAKVGRFATCFCCDCNPKLFGHATKTHLMSQQSDIMYVVAGCQSSSGLIESHWKTMVHMSCAYLIKKHMSRNFWFPLIRHTT